MDSPGVIGTLRLAGVVVLSLPLVLLGIERLIAGSLLGLVFVGLGVTIVVLERLLTNPLDPVDVAEAGVDRVTSRVVEESEDGDAREQTK